MNIWFLLLVLQGEVWATGPYTEEQCYQRMKEERGPVACIAKNSVLIRMPVEGECHEDDVVSCDPDEFDIRRKR